MMSFVFACFIGTNLSINGLALGFFTPPSPQRTDRKASYRPHINKLQLASSSSTIEETKAKVTRVSVCTGELCQCQGEEYEYTGGAADAALQKLQSLDLSFPVDEVGCMGVCGMGTMIAIDYENGDSIILDRLESVTAELGLKTESFWAKPQPLIENVVTNENTINLSDDVILSGTQPAPDVSVKSRELTDVRERMREEAAKEDEQENPWLKMVSYLAKKAIDTVIDDNGK